MRQFDDFPIVAETYRDCLQDVLDLPHLEEVLTGIQQGEIEVVVVESRDPLAGGAEPAVRLYQHPHVRVGHAQGRAAAPELAVNRDLLQDLLKDVALDELLRPEAIEAVRGQLQHTAPTARARTAEELAVLLQQMGDLSSSEIAQRAARWTRRTGSRA